MYYKTHKMKLLVIIQFLKKYKYYLDGYVFGILMLTNYKNFVHFIHKNN